MKTYVETSTNKWEMKEGHVLDTEMTRTKFRWVFDRVKPKKIFEIGFNGGHSARMFLEMFRGDPDFRVHSVDICNHEYTEEIARELEKEDPRFSFQKISSHDLIGEDIKGYDLLFIDGDHTEEGVRNDLFLGAEADIPYMLVDDYNHKEDRWNGRIGATVDSIVGDIGFRHCYFGSTLHYEATGGINKMRLIIAYTAWKHQPPEQHRLFKKSGV